MTFVVGKALVEGTWFSVKRNLRPGAMHIARPSLSQNIVGDTYDSIDSMVRSVDDVLIQRTDTRAPVTLDCNIYPMIHSISAELCLSAGL